MSISSLVFRPVKTLDVEMLPSSSQTGKKWVSEQNNSRPRLPLFLARIFEHALFKFSILSKTRKRILPHSMFFSSLSSVRLGDSNNLPAMLSCMGYENELQNALLTCGAIAG